MKMKLVTRFLFVSVIAAVWFALLIPWQGWNDPDAFYHATVAKMIWQSGPVRAFPALDLTLLGTEFADLHFGFHVFVALFTALFGDLIGLRVATVFLAALCVAVFEACLRWLKISHSWVWAMLLAISYPFVFRMLLGKATPLALLLFLFGLAAAWKRRPWLVGITTCLFALSHGGWLFLAGSVVLMFLGDTVYSCVVAEQRLLNSIRTAPWKEVVAAFVGGLVGLCVHPNFPRVFGFAWAQVVTIGLGTPFQHVFLGTEWLPADVSSMLTSYAMWLVLALLGLSGLVLARRMPLDEDRARLLISTGLIMAALTALSFKSRRNVEYLTPIIALWCAVLWSLIEPKKLALSFFETVKQLKPVARYFVVGCVGTVCLFAVIKQLIQLRFDTQPPNYSDAVNAHTMQAISDRAQPGDRVFHSSWDEFPMLFHADQRLRYISGLDPTFLYIASSTLSDEVRDVTWPNSTSTSAETWSLISTQLDSRFIFVSKKNHAVFLQRLNDDRRYVRIADDEMSSAFMVTSSTR